MYLSLLITMVLTLSEIINKSSPMQVVALIYREGRTTTVDMERKQIVLVSLLLLLPLFLLSAQAGMTKYSNEEYKIEFSHPSAWSVVEDEGSIVLMSSPGLQAQLDADYPDLRQGEVVVNIAALPTMMFAFMGIEADSVEGQVEAMFEQMVQEGLGEAENVSQQTATSASGVQVSSVAFDAAEEVDGTMREISGLFLGMADEEKGVFGFGMAVGQRQTLDRQRSTLVDTIGSIVYTGSMEDLLGGN